MAAIHRIIAARTTRNATAVAKKRLHKTLVGLVCFGAFIGVAGADSLPILYVGGYDMPGYAMAVAVDGTYTYVADGTMGQLLVIDLSLPTAPGLAAVLSVGGHPYGLDVTDDYAYIANQDGHFQIVDISEPGAPCLVSSYATDMAFSVAVRGNTAYVGTDGMAIFDVSDPYHPVPLGTYSSVAPVYALVVRDNLAYLAGNAGLLIVDVSDPLAPTWVGGYSPGQIAFDIALSGNYAYLALNQGGGLVMIDVSNPEAPSWVGTYPGGTLWSVAVVENYAYVGHQQGVDVVDVSDPAAPQWAGNWNDGAGTIAKRIRPAGAYLHVAKGETGFVALLPGCSAWMPPTITEQPVGQSVLVCAPVTLTVQAEGDALAYQWQRDTLNLLDEGRYSGVMTNTLAISEAIAADSGAFRCIVYEACGYVTSAEVDLTVTPTLQILSGPVDLTLACGEGATFAVQAESSCPISYQWQKDGVDLADDGHYNGTTTSVLTIDSVASPDSGLYRCAVSDASDTMTSNPALLTVAPSVIITRQPTRQTVPYGDTATFLVEAESDEPLTFRWFRDAQELTDGGHYSGTATDTLMVSNVDDSVAGLYSCRVSATCDYALSRAVPLTPALTIPEAGDIFVNNIWEGIIRVNSLTGEQDHLGSVALDGFAWGMEFDTDGTLVIAQNTAISGSTPGVLRYDPVTHGVSYIASWSSTQFGPPWDVGVAPDGIIYVSCTRFVLRVDPETGTIQQLHDSGLSSVYSSVAVAEDGQVYVLEDSGMLYRLEPGGGLTQLHGVLGSSQDQYALTLARDGHLYEGVQDHWGTSRLIHVDRITGSHYTVSEGGLIHELPGAVALEATGDVVMSKWGFLSSPDVIRIDTGTGAQTLITTISSGSWQDLLGVGVYIRPTLAGLSAARPTMARIGQLAVGCAEPGTLDVDDVEEGFVTVHGIQDVVPEGPIKILVDVSLSGATGVDDVVADLIAAGLAATADDPLLSEYSFDILVSFANPGFAGPLFFAWDLSRYGNVAVARVGAYWSPFAEADFNCDGAVNNGDFMVLATCLAGPNMPQADGCRRTDLDGDEDTDLADFAVFQDAAAP